MKSKISITAILVLFNLAWLPAFSVADTLIATIIESNDDAEEDITEAQISDREVVPDAPGTTGVFDQCSDDARIRHVHWSWWG